MQNFKTSIYRQTETNNYLQKSATPIEEGPLTVNEGE
jgi:hypothetical protein